MIRIIILRIRRTPPSEENTAMRIIGASLPECSRNSVSVFLSLMRIFNATETFEAKVIDKPNQQKTFHFTWPL